MPLLQGRADEDRPGIVMGKALLLTKRPNPLPIRKILSARGYHLDSFQGRTVKTIIGAKQILKYRRDMENAGTPVTNASKKSYPTIEFVFEINTPFYIVQKKDSLYFFFEKFHEIWPVRMAQQHK